jgi:DNA-binding transcriptional MerR regulator
MVMYIFFNHSFLYAFSHITPLLKSTQKGGLFALPFRHIHVSVIRDKNAGLATSLIIKKKACPRREKSLQQNSYYLLSLWRFGMMDRTHKDEQIVPIGELCNELGISTRTLRYWEEVGIIEAVERQSRSNRGYTPYMVRRIKFIIKLKDLGLTIKEMQHLYKIYGEAKETEALIPELIRILDQHINMVDEKIAKLSNLRTEVVEYRRRIIEKQNSKR